MTELMQLRIGRHRGISSASFYLPIQCTEKKELVGTDIFQGFLLVTAGATAYLFAGTINWTITGLLLIGSLPGVVNGSQLSKRIPNRIMRPVMAVVLAVSGFKLI